MENVLADEAEAWGGEYDATEWAVLVSLYGDDLDLSDVDEPLDYDAAMEAQIEVPSPS